jgi:CRP-like cAMP-binding protein
MKLLTTKLLNFASLGGEETDALDALPGVERRYASLDDIREEPGTWDVMLLTSGFAGVSPRNQDDRRSIVFLMVPGDLAGIRTLITGDNSSSVLALSDVTIFGIRSQSLLHLGERYPRIASALWSATLTEESILHQSILGFSRRSAIERTAHLLCELHARLSAVGLVDGKEFSLPLTQSHLGEILGLSTVHVNRTLQELRRQKMIATEGRRFVLENLDGLRGIAGFDPSYLHYRPTRGQPKRSTGDAH